MVLFALICRTADGLPLSASTDFDDRPGFRESQRIAKVLTKQLDKFPDRCTLETDQNFEIYYISSLGLCFLCVCEVNYPTVLAFSFLDELQREFIMTYDHTEVRSIVRPYTYIDFDTYMQKTKQKYSNPHSLITRLNLNDMNTEIKLRPPHKITMDDIWPYLQNGMSPPPHSYGSTQPQTPSRGYNTGAYSHRVKALQRLVPVDWLGVMSIVLNLLCSALNLMRGLGVINHRYLEYVEGSGFSYGMIFLFAAVTALFQIYLLLYSIKWRQYLTIGTVVVLVLCNIQVWGLRNIWQILFHIAAAGFSYFNAVRRKVDEKLSGYNV